MFRLPPSFLFWQMGLGKTLQTLTLIWSLLKQVNPKSPRNPARLFVIDTFYRSVLALTSG